MQAIERGTITMNGKFNKRLIKEEKRIEDMSFEDLLIEREIILDKIQEINAKVEKYNEELYKILSGRSFCLKSLMKNSYYHKRNIAKADGRIAASQYERVESALNDIFAKHNTEAIIDGLGQVAYMKPDGYSVKSYEPIEKYFPEQEM